MLTSVTIIRIRIKDVGIIIMMRDAVTIIITTMKVVGMITPKTNMFMERDVVRTTDNHINTMRVADMIIHRIKSDN